MSRVCPRYVMRSPGKLLEVAAVSIFIYSVWFYIQSGPGAVLDHQRPLVTEPRIMPKFRPHKEAGKIVDTDLLFSGEKSSAGDGNEEEKEDEEERSGGSHVVQDLDMGDDHNEPVNPPLTGFIDEDQKNINYIADHLIVSVVVRKASPNFYIEVTLKNGGNQTINKGKWFILFCHTGGLVKPQTDQKFTVNSVQGNMFLMNPSTGFTSLAPSESMMFRLADLAAASDTFANWYVSEEDLEPRIIVSTSLRRYKPDFTQVDDVRMLPSKRYDINSEVPVKPIEPGAIRAVPSPLQVDIKHPQKLTSVGRWSEWVILHTGEVSTEAKYLSGVLGGLPLQNYEQKSKFIQITTGKVKLAGHRTTEGYHLYYRPSQQSVTIIGADPAGAFYGVQTFLSIISKDGKDLTEFPEFDILDAPHMEYRGLMLDVARSFMETSEVLKFLDVMATYKLNKLHLHLTDDQGWRLEIPGLEELTKLGSRRGHDLAEARMLHPFFGAGPHGNSSPGTGYYSVKDYRKILEYAHRLHIEVIPEIDLPGHSHAAIRAMQARVRRLSASHGLQNVSALMTHALADPKDRAKYTAVNNFKVTTVNPCMASTFTFLDHVLTEIVKMHQDVQPLTTFHLGGDEVPADALRQSPLCEDFKQAHPQYKTTSDLKRYFMEQASRLLAEKKLGVQVWEDGIYNADNDEAFEIRPEGIRAQIWKGGKKDRMYDLAKQGFKVVLSPGTHTYLDHPYETHIEERGYHWATNQISESKIFSYNPLDGSVGRKRPVINNIIGMEAALWGETIRHRADAHSMTFPRLLAFAERCWSPLNTSRTSWVDFANTLVQKELPRLETWGVGYRIPPPGVRLENDRLHSNTALPGLVVQMWSNQSHTWSDIANGDSVPKGRVAFATRSHNSKRKSRTVWVHH